jgi:pimeloyl-ACP methyl ester carboxylesterase
MDNLILLHGALGDANQLAPLKKALSEYFNVYSFHFSGHGGWPAVPFSVDALVDDIERFMEDNNLQTACVFGYSMGGYVAFEHARRYPGKITRLFTLGTKWEWNPETADRETRMLNVQKIREKVPSFADLLAKRHGDPNWENVTHFTADFMQSLGNSPFTQQDFVSVEIPVCVASGDQDNVVSVEESLRITRQLQSGQAIILPDTFHPFERVDITRLTAEIVRFFKR